MKLDKNNKDEDLKKQYDFLPKAFQKAGILKDLDKVPVINNISKSIGGGKLNAILSIINTVKNILNAISTKLNNAFDSIKGTEATKQALDKNNAITDVLGRNDTLNKAFDKNLKSTSDYILAGFKDVFKESVERTVTPIIGLLRSLYKIVSPLNKYENLGSQEATDIINENTIRAMSGGMDKENATVFGEQITGIINDMLGSDGVSMADSAEVAKAVNSAIESGDFSNLSKYIPALTNEAVMTWKYNQGMDMSGNTQYTRAYEMGMNLQALKEMVNYDEKMLQEMTRTGYYVKNISKQFDWEAIETVSSIDTNTGAFDNNGDFIRNELQDKELEVDSSNLENTINKNTDALNSFGGRWAENVKINMNNLVNREGGALTKLLDQDTLSSLDTIRSLAQNIPKIGSVKDLDISKHAEKQEVNVKVALDVQTTPNEYFDTKVKEIVNDENYRAGTNNFKLNMFLK